MTKSIVSNSKLLLLLLLLFGITSTNIFAQTATKKTTPTKPPFQGTQYYCSQRGNQTYEVTFKGNNLTISYPHFKATGIFKNGLILTNDPDEIKYRKSRGKRNYGKYYIIYADYMGWINFENSEYFTYNKCTLEQKLLKDKN